MTNIKKLQEYLDCNNLDFINEYLSEITYCYENKLDVIDFDCWIHIEGLLDCKMSFDDYLIISKDLDNIESISKQDEEVINRMKVVFNRLHFLNKLQVGDAVKLLN